jgi:hypothetical protein
MTRTIKAMMNDSGRVFVEYSDHFTKRELLRVLNTIKSEHRQKVREYRRKKRLELHEKIGESNGERNERQSGSERSDSNSREQSSDSTNEAPTGGLAAAVAGKERIRAAEGPRGGRESS